MNELTRIFLAVGIAINTLASCAQPERLTQWVDPRIGSGGHGHVFVGASVPFGMVQLGPTSIPQDWDWCSGYHESDSTVIGFSHTHLSGTGIGDLFDVTVMPVVGEVTYARGRADDPSSGMWSYADRTREVALAGYYSVPLTRYGILAEMTSTERVGFHRYTFPASAESALVFDLQNGGCWDRPIETHLEARGDRRLVGWRYSRGWARDQRVYFVAEFSKPFTSLELHGADDMYGRVSFATTQSEQVLLKVALSPVSVEGALANIEAELAGWDFENAVRDADRRWERELSRARITTEDRAIKRTFYTALYHTMISPSLFCDVDGSYRGADGLPHPDPGTDTYTVFSLWDTYRAAMPLMSILQPDRMPSIVDTWLRIYDEQGKLPVWHLWGNETDCMVGNPGVAAMGDAVLKGYAGTDRRRALEAMKASSMLDERGMDLLKKYGYIPCEFNESVGFGMEYAIADWAVARLAQELGQDADAAYFTSRSHSYRRYFDPQTRFMRGVDSLGRFREPFDPFHSRHRQQDYTEGNAWQYTWLAPHDVEGLVECFGGSEPFFEKLDSLFIVRGDLGAEASPDISGLIGQYAHGNEPSHHIVYLYTMLGRPWQTADLVREILTTLYHDAADGLSGNEDAGQMSAWYVLSSLGFYQVEPAGGRYYFGSPLVDAATLKVAGGRFSITAHNNSPQNKYIQSVRLNRKPYTKPYIDFSQIVAGGRLEFTMGPDPALWYEL